MLRRILILVVIICAVPLLSNAQPVTESPNYGIWQGFGDAMNKTIFPEIKGRLCNFRWADLEAQNNVWNWTAFDSTLADRAKDSLPIIFMVYTEEDAPEWLYATGIPKVLQYDDKGNVIAYSPYYANNKYKAFFKRMITKVHQHVETLPASTRQWIIGVQGCYGSTGDYIGYKGSVDPQYALNSQDFYNLFIEFSSYVYTEYLNTSPKIYLLSNPQNNGQQQMNWLIQNCPNGWIKCGSLGKGFQLNDELYKYSWLYPLLNYPQNGEYIRSRSELQGDPDSLGWWSESKYKNMFALMCYCIYWGLDWSNQAPNQITDHNYDAVFDFYNRYAGQKDAAAATNAMCLLRDGLDAQDTSRFPVSKFGAAIRENISRYQNIAAAYSRFGAKLEDPLTVTQSENYNLLATGINDVGWNILNGNYDRYLHQINPNASSVGLWNLNTSAEPNSVYGKYARGFQVNAGKNALYFDVDSAFLTNRPLNGAYPVMISITYLDSGYGGFQLYYDSKTGGANKASISVTCNNTKKWKQASVTLYDAYFNNRSQSHADFFIKATNTQNVIFSHVELTRPDRHNPLIGLNTNTQYINFDSVCVNTTSKPMPFVLNATFLDGTPVKIGPVNGYQFAADSAVVYKDSLVFSNYGAAINKTIYVRVSPTKQGVFISTLPINGGGYGPLYLTLRVGAGDSRPILSASIKNISCNGKKDGAIDLQVTGGEGPFTYLWTSDAYTMSASTEDIADLVPADYTVVVSANVGCTTSATYTITEPSLLAASASLDSNILCKNGSTTIRVRAAGGVKPYTGTGIFSVTTGNYSYPVTDANGCSTVTDRISVANGTLTAPAKPGDISSTDTIGVCGGGIFSYKIDPVTDASGYLWTLPDQTSLRGQNPDQTGISVAISAQFTGGSIMVAAANACGVSNSSSRTISLIPQTPAGVNGPANVNAQQKNTVYKIINPAPGVSYSWSVPNGATITSGQNTWKITVDWGTLSGKVVVRAFNDCGNSTSATLDVNVANGFVAGSDISGALSVTAKSATNNILFLPNPVQNTGTLFLHTYISTNIIVSVADVAGRNVYRKEVKNVYGSSSEKLDLSNLKPGVYFLSVTDSKANTAVLKLVKL